MDPAGSFQGLDRWDPAAQSFETSNLFQPKPYLFRDVIPNTAQCAGFL
jgi:hypothetical protein